jgi:hypothetical protein
MRAWRPLNSGKTALAVGLVTALAALGLAAGPFTTASAQTNSRVCGVFWYTQVPDPTNDNKLTWFTLGVAIETNTRDYCDRFDHKKVASPDLVAFRKSFPNLPLTLGKGERWEVSGIDKVTCEDFATRIAQPPNGEEILDRGQNWPVGDQDPCLSWERGEENLFWFKHL